jgi:hypothetical protein
MRFAHTLHSHGSLPPSLPLRVCSQLPLAEVDRLDGEGRIFRGKIRINPKNFEQGFIPGGKREVSLTHIRIRRQLTLSHPAKPSQAVPSHVVTVGLRGALSATASNARVLGPARATVAIF